MARDNLRMKFSPLNADFSSLSRDPIDLRRPVYAGVTEEYPLKVAVIPLLARLA